MNRFDLMDKYPCGGGIKDYVQAQPNVGIIHTVLGKDIPQFVPGYYCLVLETKSYPNPLYMSSRIRVDDVEIATTSGECTVVGSYPTVTALGFAHIDYNTKIEYEGGVSKGVKVRLKYKWCLVHPD